MYQLTLSRAERQAIDWIGNRYWNGNELFTLLWCDSSVEGNTDEWDAPEDITFMIPEHVAWIIQENAESEGFPCFSPELSEKFYTLMNQIV